GHPRVPTAIEMNHLTEARAALAAAAMPAAGAAPRDEARLLEGMLHEGVRQRDRVRLTGAMQKMAHAPPQVLLAIHAQDALDLRDRRAPRRGHAAAAIEQSVVSLRRVALAQAPHRARRHAQDLGGFIPAQLSTQSFQ